MNIKTKIYFLENSYDYNGDDLNNESIGGSEKTLINITNALSLDNNFIVKVFNNTSKPKIINKVKIALKILVFIFLFNKSKYFIPENSILIRCSPTIPKVNGNKKLIKFGKNEVKCILKKEPKNTSKTEIKNKNEPVYKYVFKFCLSGFKKLIFLIIFPLLLFFCYTNSLKQKLLS